MAEKFGHASKRYTLDCDYYDKSFDTVQELVADVIESGMDPNYEILRNFVPTGELAIEYIQF